MHRRQFLQTTAASVLVGLSSSSYAAEASRLQLQGTDVNGKPLGLQDFAGRVVLVSFFTVDCDVCSKDLKLMREFYAGNSSKKFTLLGVNLDKNKKELDEYNEVTTQAYPKSQRFPTAWRMAPGHKDNFGNISSTPTHFVLDARHQLVFKREGAFRPDDWDRLWELLA
ncbi:TlpA family protein disulfide reductase [Undibacterium curvum]|uniref:TlpA family protein disulfide reductase n=1 Tax=Undibacterium curvum TaxID=2762294 RepID=A0ABR7A1X6_9BURK|nr:TlpA disulfide reductase family protein [Undibacterium curvum]MBC3930771.1 TlpA family protein disulfide reductase [Undibacterium curvum]